MIAGVLHVPSRPPHGPVHLSGRNSFLVTARDLRLEGEGGHDNDYDDHDYNRDYSDHDRDRDDHDVMILKTPLIQMLMMI